MKQAGVWIRRVVLVIGMSVVVGGYGRTQVRSTVQTPGMIPGVPQSSDPLHGKSRDEAQFPPEMVEKQAKARNNDRQRRLVSDTEKLLALATSLHEDVAKTDKNVLSLDVVKRADEIEKLAHSVKERMKG